MGSLASSGLIAKINLSQRALVHYDLFAISRVLRNRRSEVTPVEFPWGNPVQLGRGNTLFDGLLPEVCITSILLSLTPVPSPGATGQAEFTENAE